MTTIDQGTPPPPGPPQRRRVRILILVSVLSVMCIAVLIDQAGEEKWVLSALGYKNENRLDRASVLAYLDEKVFPLTADRDAAAKDKRIVTLKKNQIWGLRLVHAPNGREDLTGATFSVKADGVWYEFEILMPTEIPTDEWRYVNPAIRRVTKL